LFNTWDKDAASRGLSLLIIRLFNRPVFKVFINTGITSYCIEYEY
jgi:hypothetical protein